MLEGKELLEKAKLLSKKSEDEIAKGCGYVGPSGRILRKSFYRALIEAKGYKIGNGRQGKNGNRNSRGRQTEFKTKVHGNGNLLIGHAYTKKLGLEPFGLTDSLFASTFYALTGFHGLHVTLGTLMILIIAWQSRINGGRVTSRNMFPLEAVELYWHFVDGIWVILFIILYLL